MRPSRTDVFPMLVILAGGSLGALLTLAPLLLFGPSNHVPAPAQPAWAPTVSVPAPLRPVTGRAVPVWSPDGTSVVFESTNGRVYRVDVSGGEPEPVQVSPDGQWIAYQSEASGETRISVVDLENTTLPVVLSGNGSFWARGGGLNPGDIESIEVLRGDAAVALYGERSSTGVIRVTLKAAR